MAEEQEGDESLRSFLAEKSHKVQTLLLSSGRNLIQISENSNLRTFIPLSLRQQLFYDHHNLCHPSTRDTKKELTKKYFWPYMNKDISKWCAECLPCQESKITRHIKLPPKTIPVPRHRFQHINVDIVGPLPPAFIRLFLSYTFYRFRYLF